MTLKVKERASKKALKLQSSFLTRTKKTSHNKLKGFSLLSSLFGIHFPGGSEGKEFACDARDPSSIPVLGRFPEEGKDYLFQYSCLENSMNRGVWWTTVHEVAKSWIQLSN